MPEDTTTTIYYYVQVVLPLGQQHFEFQDIGPGWDNLDLAKQDLALWRRVHPTLTLKLVDHRGEVEA